jgi:hypothetical protein
MKKFVFVYYGGYNPQELSNDKMKAVMDKWMKWFDSMKDKTVDGGNPFGPGKAVTAEGTRDVPADMWPAKGYTIVNAPDMSSAVTMARACPILQEGNGATVRVYEAMPM